MTKLLGSLLLLLLLVSGCSAPIAVLDKASCVIEAKTARDARIDFRQTMKNCRQDADCVVYSGVCAPDVVHRRYETCAIWQVEQTRPMTKCAAYLGDISKVTASCDAGICVAHDPWKPNF